MSSTGARPFSSRSSRSASRFGRQQGQEQQRAAENEQIHAEMQQLSEDLNVRVRGRDSSGAMEERPRSRLGQATSSSIEQKASELKDTLTRPLSSLFRRSNSNDRAQGGGGQLQAGPAQSSNAAMPPLPSRPAPTARGPLTNQAGGFGGATSGRGIGGTNIANGATATGEGSASSLTTTTTATRPFSGFPGKRPANAPIQGQQPNISGEQPAASNSLQLEIDLSEQAATAPHINIRRFSGITTDASSLFLNRVGQRQQSGNNRTNAEIDVNFLSRFLCPEDEIQDEQIPWTWDSLFASVTSELREEWALEEEANNNNEVAVELGGGGVPMPNGPLQQQQRYTPQKGF